MNFYTDLVMNVITFKENSMYFNYMDLPPMAQKQASSDQHRAALASLASFTAIVDMASCIPTLAFGINVNVNTVDGNSNYQASPFQVVIHTQVETFVTAFPKGKVKIPYNDFKVVFIFIRMTFKQIQNKIITYKIKFK